MRTAISVLHLGLTLPLALLGACASGPSHVQLKFPATESRNKEWQCRTTEDADKTKKERCWPLNNGRSSSDENKSGTLHFVPPECKAGFDMITIEDLDSDEPKMFVVCQQVPAE